MKIKWPWVSRKRFDEMQQKWDDASWKMQKSLTSERDAALAELARIKTCEHHEYKEDLARCFDWFCTSCGSRVLHDFAPLKIMRMKYESALEIGAQYGAELDRVRKERDALADTVKVLDEVVDRLKRRPKSNHVKRK
jgi:hypothetical protein